MTTINKKIGLQLNPDVFIEVGSDIYGLINKKHCKGKLQIEDDKYYFCQDLESGNSCKNKLGFKYSWTFSKTSNNRLTENVELFNADDKSFTKHITLLNKKSKLDKELIKIEEEISSNNIKILTKESSGKYSNAGLTFCIQNVPYCCGAVLLYDISVSEAALDLEKAIDDLKSYISKGRSYKEVYITEKQVRQLDIFKKAGFKEINSFVNSNTKTIIYHLCHEE